MKYNVFYGWLGEGSWEDGTNHLIWVLGSGLQDTFDFEDTQSRNATVCEGCQTATFPSMFCACFMPSSTSEWDLFGGLSGQGICEKYELAKCTNYSVTVALVAWCFRRSHCQKRWIFAHFARSVAGINLQNYFVRLAAQEFRQCPQQSIRRSSSQTSSPHELVSSLFQMNIHIRTLVTPTFAVELRSKKAFNDCHSRSIN